MGMCLEGIVPQRAHPRRVGHQRFHTTMPEVVRTHTGESQSFIAVFISHHHFAVETYSGDTTRPRKERSRSEPCWEGSTFWPGLVGSDGDPDDAVAAVYR